MLLSDPSVGRHLGGQSDKYGRFTRRQIRSGLRSMKNFSLRLWKKVKTNLPEQINPSVSECFFPEEKKKEFNMSREA